MALQLNSIKHYYLMFASFSAATWRSILETPKGSYWEVEHEQNLRTLRHIRPIWASLDLFESHHLDGYQTIFESFEKHPRSSTNFKLSPNQFGPLTNHFESNSNHQIICLRMRAIFTMFEPTNHFILSDGHWVALLRHHSGIIILLAERFQCWTIVIAGPLG